MRRLHYSSDRVKVVFVVYLQNKHEPRLEMSENYPQIFVNNFGLMGTQYKLLKTNSFDQGTVFEITSP